MSEKAKKAMKIRCNVSGKVHEGHVKAERNNWITIVTAKGDQISWCRSDKLVTILG